MKWFVWASVLASVVGLSACGGSDDGDSSSSNALTKDELITQADEICTTYDQASDDIELPEGIPNEDLDELDDEHIEALSAYIAEGVKAFKVQVADLAALTPPEDLEDDWKSLIEDLEAMQAALEDGHAAVDDADQEAFDTFDEQISELGADATKKAKAIGLEVCGQ